MAHISLSINPLYRCNFRCNFCYLTTDQLKSRQVLDVNVLRERLAELSTGNYTIDSVDLYGGEVELLSADQYTNIINTVREVYTGNINVVSNLYLGLPHIVQPNMTLSVSYDFKCREHSDEVYNNILSSPHDVHVLVLASSCLINQDVEEMISTLNAAHNVRTVEIKPYSSNQANDLQISYVQYEQHIKKWITASTPKRFTFINEHRIQEVFGGHRNAFSDDHLYITPLGQFAVLDFDINDNEYFKTIHSLDDYRLWSAGERAKVTSNRFCGDCKYLGGCLTEHYRDVKTLDNSCNGFKFLLEWYDERVAASTTSISPIDSQPR